MTRARIKAILLAHGFRVPDGMTDLKPYVYEAVEAVLAEAGAPEGWQRVPVEPTLEMSEAGAYSTGDTVNGRPVWKAPIDEQVSHIYRAMLAAAPTPPVRAESTSGERVRSEPEIEQEPAAYFQFDKLADGTMYYEQVKAEYRNDADVIPLYAHPPALRLPEPMVDAEVFSAMDAHEFSPYDLARWAEAETLRRVRERNAVPTPPVRQEDEALEALRELITAFEMSPGLRKTIRVSRLLDDARALIAKRGEK